MPTLYRLDNFGGFTVADTAENISAYAEPSSTFAIRAGDRPAIIASEMLAMAYYGAQSRDADAERRHNRNIVRIEEGRANGSTIETRDDMAYPHVREGLQEAHHYAQEEIRDVQQYFGSYDPTKARSAAVFSHYQEQARREQFAYDERNGFNGGMAWNKDWPPKFDNAEDHTPARDTPYPRYWDAATNELIEDRSVTGSFIDNLDKRLQTGDILDRKNEALSKPERDSRHQERFAEHIKAWDCPAMALTKTLDGDRPNIVVIDRNADANDHER